jgi:hypothetical protein
MGNEAMDFVVTLTIILMLGLVAITLALNTSRR